jgi:hypothetical protein
MHNTYRIPSLRKERRPAQRYAGRHQPVATGQEPLVTTPLGVNFSW